MEKQNLPKETQDYSMEIVRTINDLDVCIKEVSCTEYEAGTEFSTKAETFSPSQHEFYFKSQVSYHCGPGRGFRIPESGEIIGIQNLTCLWNQSWAPSNTVLNCTCKNCKEPLTPELFRRMLHCCRDTLFGTARAPA